MSTFKYQFIVFFLILILTTLIISFYFTPILWLFTLIVPIIIIATYDIFQKTHTILRLYPVIGRLRYVFEAIRPEIQQYFVEDDTSGIPINREFRSLKSKGRKRYSFFWYTI